MIEIKISIYESSYFIWYTAFPYKSDMLSVQYGYFIFYASEIKNYFMSIQTKISVEQQKTEKTESIDSVHLAGMLPVC